METRTLGSFLATLRKANGLTQKDLAEKLGVSDKAISRWERDECAPDLTLIPVIADIFGVTTDELLRGQRNNPENPRPEQPTKKSEKQLNRILKENKTRFLTNSLIAGGSGVVGLIAAMVCNLAFLRAYLGFFVGSAFYLAAGIMEAIFTIRAFSAVGGEEDFEEETLSAHRRELKAILKCAVFGLCLLLLVTLPLVIHVYDAYWGLNFGSWLLLALVYAIAGAALFLLGQWIYQGVQLRNSKEDSTPKTQKARKLHRLQARVMGIAALALLLTFLLQLGFNTFSEARLPFAAGETFQNIDDFYDWAMVEPENSYTHGDWGQDEIEIEYFDEHGNSITAEELREQALDGTTFDRINAIISLSSKNISRTRFKNDGSYFPLIVHTDADWRTNEAVTQGINIFFIFLYLGEIAAAIVFYRKQRKNI